MKKKRQMAFVGVKPTSCGSPHALPTELKRHIPALGRIAQYF